MPGEHQPEVAPEPAAVMPAAAPAVSSAAAVPAGARAGPSRLSVAGVLALQRSVGNAAVGAMLARQGPAAPAAPAAPKEGPLTPEEITVTGGDPKPQGGWAMSSKVENGKLYLESPEVKFDAELKVPEPPEKRKIPSTTVGFIQTVESADRKGIYTRDGTPSGTPVANKHTSVSDKRDAKTNFVMDESGDLKRDASGEPVQWTKALPPWYDDPSYLDEQQRETKVSTMDRTRTNFPLEIDHLGKKGRLAQTGGADKFQMAVSMKPGNAPATSLKSMDWETPWRSTVDPASHAVSGTGHVWVHPSDVPLGDQKEPTGVANKDKIDWVAITTVADAKALGAQKCLSLLLLARQFDQESYEAMATALREMNPHLAVDVFAGETTGESVTIEAEGGRGVHMRTASTPTGVAFRLLDFYDPNDLGAGTTIKVRVRGPRGGQTAGDWAFPFGGGPSLDVDGVPVKCRFGAATSFAAPAPAAVPAGGPAPPPPPPIGPPAP